ncbi:MAG: SpoIIE family protein phosphatase [Phycisphaerae bacterium]|nr:SpoIIE family protein phosphatase [Phycisphaerae bacterium]
MRIRWKLLILLLAIALVPLICVRISTVVGTMRVGRSEAARARETQTRQARDSLLHTVEYQAMALRWQGRVLRLALQLQAREAERLLAEPPPEDVRPVFSAEYDRGRDLPEGMTTSPRYRQRDAAGELQPIPITYQEQVFTLAAGVAPEEVAADVARLTGMLSIYQFFHDADETLIFWQYTGLENGVLGSYPGHGGYPPDFDHRTRDWYRLARERGRMTFTPPYIDASSRKVTITMAMPLYDTDGTFVGVTALDVLVNDIVNRIDKPPLVAQDHLAFVTVPVDRPDLGGRGLLIVGRDYDTTNDRLRDEPYEVEWLQSDDSEQLEAMHQDILARRSGVRQMGFQGRDSLWAYGMPPDGGVAFVMIVPREVVIAQAAAAEQEVLDRVWYEVRKTGAIFVGVLLVVIVAAFLSSRSVTRPIRALADTAERIAHGDLDARANVITRDEFGELGKAFNTMVPQLRDRMRLRESLALAMEVQQNLLPAGPPEIEGLDIAGRSIYCDETGGDYYDFLDLAPLGPRTLAVAVGDVTGHGIAAALLMTAARALLRSHATQPGSLAQLMNAINYHLTIDTPDGRFMTLYYLVLDMEHRQARWMSAGHDAAIVYDPATQSFAEYAGRDIPLGIETSWTYTEFGPEPLKSGHVIAIGTDGIWESQNPEGRMFGKDALRDIIRRHADRPAAEISHAVTDAIAAFRGTHPQEDDITLVVIKVNPPVA